MELIYVIKSVFSLFVLYICLYFVYYVINWYKYIVLSNKMKFTIFHSSFSFLKIGFSLCFMKDDF